MFSLTIYACQMARIFIRKKEMIKVMGDKTLVIILKGGYEIIGAIE